MIEIKLNPESRHVNWITENVVLEDIEYNWRNQTIIFFEDEDALAFKLKFSGYDNKN